MNIWAVVGHTLGYVGGRYMVGVITMIGVDSAILKLVRRSS